MKKTTRYLFLLVALVMAFTFVLVACDNEPVVTIKLSQTEVTIRVGGKSAKVTATVSDGGEVTWSSSDTSIATVVGGVISPVAVGTATVTATSGSVSATCKVTVMDALPTSHNKTYEDDGKTYTSHSYMKNSPSNWNEMDYQMNDDTAILNYIQSSFFTYEYALKDEAAGRVTADGKLNVDNLDFDNVILTYDAATALEDVTAEYADEWGLTAEQKADGGYIWKITIRDDLAWDDGKAIYADDFVYSMQEQLNYLLRPFRADTYWSSNGMKIHNAKNYYYQGREVDIPVEISDLSDLVKGEDGVYTWSDGTPLFLGVYEPSSDLDGDALGEIVEYYMSTPNAALFSEAWTVLEPLLDEDGKAPVTDQTVQLVAALLAPFGMGDYALNFIYMHQSFAPLTFDQVGIFADDELNIIVVLDQAESWLKSDGSLSWHVSNCSLPLVKKDLYESCKQEPALGADNWTTTYNTSVETTASWGPYKLTFFQEDKQFVLSRNEYWYGYIGATDQYLTDSIVVDVIATSEAARMAFWKGEIDDLDFSDLGDLKVQYQNSDYSVFTPSSNGTAYGIQLYSNLSVLKESGCNNGILAIREFRWALNLAFDRQAFIEDQLIGMQVGLGLLGPAYYYDPENALSYRNTEQAQAALLRTYGFTQNAEGKWTDGQRVYREIDDALDAMTGYNLTAAKEKLALAITELTNNAEKYGYDSSKDIIIRLGEFNKKAPRRAELLQACIDKLVEGTVLEGKIKIAIVDAYTNSADDFRDGKFELYCVAGIGGAIFYPFSTMDNYLGWGSLSYHEYANTNASLTMTMPAGDYAGAGETLTLTIKDWFNSLNNIVGEGTRSYNWGEGACPMEVRLEILAMLEEYALSQFYSIQVADDYNVYMTTAKTSNISDEYNIFMGFGGSRYIRYNYTDEEWAAFVESQGGDLSTYYKTSAN